MLATVTVTVTTIVLTAILSSVCTLGFSYWLYSRRWHDRLEARLVEIADTLEGRVRKGVKDAGIELLPAFQERVEAGFKNALADIQQQGVSTIARAGASIIEEGLSTLFGKRDRD
jgi:hypothetical protein